ncbi:MAG: hypothetical protein M1829_002268 [Trizodia sp. TS-e1964]|nr:MAG: hypothetical protein M1829_002268 [Trizodia sp. TS-e1964]
MGGIIEALYIFDQSHQTILQHVYTSRPLAANIILPLYLAHPAPRPSLIYLPNTLPPTLIFSIAHGGLLFISPASAETEPLFVLEFLRRVIDILEEFLGPPLVASKIEGGYDIVAQLLGEVCDAGMVSCTEPNALRDAVEVPGWMGKLLSGVGLPGAAPFSGSSTNPLSLQAPTLTPPTSLPHLPWRRANVRHTNNELYVDIIETLSATIAPSGRPLRATSSGTIAVTSKVSGVPEIVLTLSTPSGKAGIERALELPVFHPCVRLARWRERPGELSFVPPDGRFVLAGYEVDLLPFTSGKAGSTLANTALHLPASVGLKTGLGGKGDELEARLFLTNTFPNAPANTASRGGGGLGSRLGTASPVFGGSSNTQQLENVVVCIPLPPTVQNISDLRASRGEARYAPGDPSIEWHVSSKEASPASSSGGAMLRCTLVGAQPEAVDDEEDTGVALDEYTYQATPPVADKSAAAKKRRDERAVAANAALMPRSATVSFAVRGWLASGVRVDSLVIEARKSRGLGEGVRPYKGVKYLTVSRQGVQIRC